MEVKCTFFPPSLHSTGLMDGAASVSMMTEWDVVVLDVWMAFSLLCALEPAVKCMKVHCYF